MSNGMTIRELQQQCFQASSEKGFWPKDEQRNIGELLMLITSELGEALEADRKGALDDHIKHRFGLEVELADAVIRICDMCGGLGMDLQGAIEDKLAFNKTRPPKHGKRY